MFSTRFGFCLVALTVVYCSYVVQLLMKLIFVLPSTQYLRAWDKRSLMMALAGTYRSDFLAFIYAINVKKITSL